MSHLLAAAFATGAPRCYDGDHIPNPLAKFGPSRLHVSVETATHMLSTGADPDRRNGNAWAFILLLWACTILYFDPALLVLATAAPRAWQSCFVAVWVACLNAFWLFALYYAVMGAAAWIERRSALTMKGSRDASRPSPGDDAESLPQEGEPGVVLLYATCNDFREEGVDALLKIEWPHCSVVICDDSTLPDFRERIDAFADSRSASGSAVRVVRRENRAGWKAGNINNALRSVSDEFSYFAICDCDGVFPPDFVRRCLGHFHSHDPASEPIAFVQTRQEANPAQKEWFGRAMSPAVGAHFRHCVAARQRYGFVMFYGHGALISTEAWRDAGGLPEIVTEDLAFSLRLRAHGWRGVYAHEIVCLEDFPPTCAHLRKRTDKWIRGTAECLKTHFLHLWRAKNVPWWEKVDVLVHGTTHFMALPMLLFLILLATVLPGCIKEFQVPGSFFLPAVPDGKSLVERAMGLRYHVFWSWDFYVMMLLTMAGTWLPFLTEASDRARATGAGRLHYIAVSTFVHLAALFVETAATVGFIFNGRAYFRATYDFAEEGTPRSDSVAHPATSLSDSMLTEEHVSGRSKAPLGSFSGQWVQPLHPNHLLFSVAELLIGAGFAVALVRWHNLWFGAPAIALMLIPFVRLFGYQSAIIRILIFAPLLLIMALFVLIGWQLISLR